MKKFLFYLGLVLTSVAQVTWASFLLIQGVVLPLTVFYLWAVGAQLKFRQKAGMAFAGGVLLDTLGSGTFGRHTLALLMAVGVMELIETRTLYGRWVSRSAALAAAIFLYVGTLRLI